MSQVYEHNRRAWDERVARRDWYIDTATEADFQRPLAVVDPCGWLGGDVVGKQILCLAAGGGRHGVLLASAGAVVTVVDLSPKMLELDRALASARGLAVRTVAASMDDLTALASDQFDAVVQPVSTCYVPDIRLVYREVARVLRVGGVYVSQHKQPVNLQATAVPIGAGYTLVEPYVRQGPLPEAERGWWHREAGTWEFLHRWSDLLGGLCQSGFVIEDVAEPRHGDARAEPGTFPHRSLYVPPYIKLKARRVGEATTTMASRLWLPR